MPTWASRGRRSSSSAKTLDGSLRCHALGALLAIEDRRLEERPSLPPRTASRALLGAGELVVVDAPAQIARCRAAERVALEQGQDGRLCFEEAVDQVRRHEVERSARAA